MPTRKFFKRLLWTLLIVFICMNVIAYFHAYKFTHFDPSEHVKTNAGHLSFTQKIGIALFGISNPRPQSNTLPNVPYETIKLKSNKTIECWLIKADSSKETVILFHGYGGEKSSMLDKAYVFISMGYNTMLVDFMGSGGSDGNETTIGFMEAEEVIACVEYLKSHGETKIILFGTSLGAAAIMKALNDQQLPINAAIIECPFGTMLKTVENRFSTMGVPSFPMAHLLVFWGGIQGGFNAFNHKPVEYAKKIKCPVLLMYGEQDPKVTRQEIDDIFNNLSAYKKLVTFPLAGHENYLLKYRDKWIEETSAFLHNL